MEGYNFELLGQSIRIVILKGYGENRFKEAEEAFNIIVKFFTLYKIYPSGGDLLRSDRGHFSIVRKMFLYGEKEGFIILTFILNSVKPPGEFFSHPYEEKNSSNDSDSALLN